MFSQNSCWKRLQERRNDQLLLWSTLFKVFYQQQVSKNEMFKHFLMKFIRKTCSKQLFETALSKQQCFYTEHLQWLAASQHAFLLKTDPLKAFLKKIGDTQINYSSQNFIYQHFCKKNPPRQVFKTVGQKEQNYF